MAIMRIHKKDRNFVILDKTFIQDRHLSLKAKGLLSYLLALPHDWEVHLTELTTHSTDGLDATKSAMRELIHARYVTHCRHRNAKGAFIQGEYVVYETPQLLPSDENFSPSDNGASATIDAEQYLPTTDNSAICSANPGADNLTPEEASSIRDNALPLPRYKMNNSTTCSANPRMTYSFTTCDDSSATNPCVDSSHTAVPLASYPPGAFPSLENWIAEQPHMEKPLVATIEQNNPQGENPFMAVPVEAKPLLLNNDCNNKNNNSKQGFSNTPRVASSPPSVAAAAIDDEKDNLILSTLTDRQRQRIAEFVFVEAARTLSLANPAPLPLEIERALLDDTCFSKAGRDFTRKFNTLKKCIRDGKWRTPHAATSPNSCTVALENAADNAARQEEKRQQRQCVEWQIERDSLTHALASPLANNRHYADSCRQSIARLTQKITALKTHLCTPQQCAGHVVGAVA